MTNSGNVIVGGSKVRVNKRMVLIPWTDMLFIFKDYLGPATLPPDAQLQRVQYHSTNKGKMCFVVESPSFEDSKDLEVRFDLKQNFTPTR